MAIQKREYSDAVLERCVELLVKDAVTLVYASEWNEIMQKGCEQFIKLCMYAFQSNISNLVRAKRGSMLLPLHEAQKGLRFIYQNFFTGEESYFEEAEQKSHKELCWLILHVQRKIVHLFDILSPAPDQITPNIRPMHLTLDMPETLNLEKNSFDHSWKERDFFSYRDDPNDELWVSEYNDSFGPRVIGYMARENHKTYASLASMAVLKSFRHHGIGSAMTRQCIESLLSRQEKVKLTVGETNRYAQEFFRNHFGFQQIGTIEHAYDKTDERACVMEYQRPEDQGGVFMS